jgi:hypothetical protein
LRRIGLLAGRRPLLKAITMTGGNDAALELQIVRGAGHIPPHD